MGLVYIAGTSTGQLIKVGFTKDENVRSESLNRTKYGGFNDWVILCTASCGEGGKMELEIGDLLRNYAISMTYTHDGKDQVTYELFSCSYQTALSAMKAVQHANGKAFRIIRESKIKSSMYEFKNLTKRRS